MRHLCICTCTFNLYAVWKDGRIEEWKNGRMEEWKLCRTEIWNRPSRVSIHIIGERERANLVVRSSGIFCLYYYIRLCRRTSCKCACAASNALLFIRNHFQIFTHFHTRCLSRYAPIDRSSQPENSPPFDGMLCNLR